MPKHETTRFKFDSIRADFDTKLDSFITSVDAVVGDKLKVKAKHRNGDGLVSTDVSGKNWKVGYDIVKKTLHGQYEHKFDSFEVKVKQRVPDFKWSVVPSLELELGTKFIKRDDISDSLELKFDMGRRLAAVEEKLKFGKKHECIVSIDSADIWDGAQVYWKTKVGKPYAKAVGARFSRKNGPIFTYNADPTERVGIKLETAFTPKVVKGEVIYKPEKADKVEVGMNFRQAFNSADKPWTGFFVKWKFD